MEGYLRIVTNYVNNKYIQIIIKYNNSLIIWIKLKETIGESLISNLNRLSSQ